jgi:hypothetical protein
VAFKLTNMVKRGRAAANLSDAEQAIHNEEKRLAQNARARARNRRKKAGVPTVLPDRFIHYRHDPPVQSGTPVPTGPTGIRTDLAIPTDQEQNDAIENLPPPILEADPLVTDPSGLPFRPLPTVDVVVSRQVSEVVKFQVTTDRSRAEPSPWPWIYCRQKS